MTGYHMMKKLWFKPFQYNSRVRRTNGCTEFHYQYSVSVSIAVAEL